jgi:PEP-CTERM motif
MIKLANIALPGFVLFVSVAPAIANPTTFAGYVQANNNQDFTLTSTSLGGGDYSVTITGSGQVSFTYSAGTPFGNSSQLATLNLTATSTFTGNCPTSSTCSGGGASYTESGFSGNFSFTANTSFMGSSNLLSGTFNLLPSNNPNYLLSGAKLSSAMGGNASTFEGVTSSSNPNQLVLTSDFLNFANTATRDATFSLASLSPIFAVQGNTGLNNGFPVNFLSLGSGTFSDLEAPEPSTFGLLGSGLLAFAFWQRKRRRHA